MNLHAAQVIDGNSTLEASGDRGRVEIAVKVSKSGKSYIATKATEYWVEETDKGTEEGENIVDLTEAINSLARPVPAGMDHADGLFSVHTVEHGLKPLVWFVGENENRKPQCLKIVA